MTIQIIGAILVIIIGFGAIKNNKTPDNLGVNNGNLAQISKKPNNVSSQTESKEKYVEPLKFIENYDKSKEKIINLLNSLPEANIITNKDDYIHAVFTTPTMKFKDDVEFYFDKTSGLIHYRSSSRVGYSDRGVNRKRYNEIAEKYYK